MNDDSGPIRVEVEIAAPRERAWDVFTNGIGSWWPGATHSIAAGRDDEPEIAIEPGVGGEIYEISGGERRHWGRITAWEPPARLAFVWRVNRTHPPTDVEVTFEPAEGGTRVVLIHSGWEALAEVNPAVRRSYGGEGGWRTVLGRFVAAF